MTLRSKLSRIYFIRCYTRIYSKRVTNEEDIHLPTSNYNVGESKYVKKILNEYSKKVDYLNAILKSSENKRRERSIKLTTERKEIIQLFQDKLCTVNSKLIPVGSSSSGLLFDQSGDIDLCLYTQNLDFYSDFRKYKGLRSFVFNQIRHGLFELRDIDPGLEVIDAFSIPHTYVPLQNIRFKNGLALDIQIPNVDFQAIRNTNLVKHYLQADSRFPQVYLYIKILFEALGLKNSKGGLLSSYHLMMLTIHFLQCRSISKPVLPVLGLEIQHRVGPDVPMEKILKLLDGEFGDYKLTWKSQNTQTTAELVFEMVNYYKNFFDVFANQIYISRGITVRRPPRKNLPTRLQIFDPYSPHTICRSFYIPDAFATGIRYIYRSMSYGRLIDTFPHFRDAQGFQRYIQEKPWVFKVKCQ